MVKPTLMILGDGRMGRAIEARANDHGYAVLGVVGRREIEEHADDVDDTLARSDVAIEVSTPASAVDNAVRCLDADCPVVVGTTGWSGEEARLEEALERSDGALLHAPNFAVGVELMRLLCRTMGAWLSGMPDFDVAMTEAHHRGKRDAPSGTARMLAEETEQASGRTMPVTSVRTGFVPGTHEIAVDGPFERIVIRHEARDRAVFADGALRAATWLRGRKGRWTLEQMFDELSQEARGKR